MTRTRADALALVNWKGVFYERYQLDRHVTALEGANGAGKTTVMIAAYVVLLPDMTKLRFTNLGESGVTGGDRGIWGRLGERGRPSYAVLDFELPAQGRLIAGVHLERKGEPSVEPTPFLVTGLEVDVRLQDLLLVTQGDSQGVPLLADLRENAARLGGRLQTLGAREYFAMLFDLGVMPLRLGTDEERSKLNEMLRTSMTGGISRGLTAELRSFLLKEESGLSDTLTRMRANLEACRRTRGEVRDARQQEREIGDVFEAGQIMFSAGFLATRERAEELARLVVGAETAHAGALEAQRVAQEQLDSTSRALQELDVRREELKGLLGPARERESTLREALAAARALADATKSRDLAEAGAARARQVRDRAEEQRALARQHLQRAQDNYQRNAEGLADLQKGIEQLHRQAGAYQQAARRLREAEAHLGVASLPPDAFDVHLETARAELATVDTQRRESQRRLDDESAHRARHVQAMQALRALAGTEVGVDLAHEVAVGALQRHRQQQDLARRLPEIEQALPEAQQLAKRQAGARALAQALAIGAWEGDAASCIGQLLSTAEDERRTHEEAAGAARTRQADRERQLQAHETLRQELEAREPLWREHHARAGRIGAHLGAHLQDRSSLDAARQGLAGQLTSAQRREQSLEEAQEALLHEGRQLLATGGPFADALLRLRDQLGAELLAGSFENVGVEEAARLEARLGGLAHALVVDDPRASARAVAGRASTLPEVLLVSRNADIEQLAAAPDTVPTGEQDVAVEEGAALRVSRIPSHPRLGRRAREQRAEQLRQEAEVRGQELEAARVERRQLERLVADGEALLAGHAIWLAGDPGPQIIALRRTIQETEAERDLARAAHIRHTEAAAALRPRLTGLRQLLPEAMLLDPPDQALRVQRLTAEREAARAAQAAVSAHAAHAQHVDRELSTLRQPPLSQEAVLQLTQQVAALKARRDQLADGIDALSYVRSNVHALAWSAAPARLASEEALLPALKNQLLEARQQQEGAQGLLDAADKRLDEARTTYNTADAVREQAFQAHAAARQRFEGLGVPEPSEEALAAASAEVRRLEVQERTQDARRDELLGQRGEERKALEQAEEALKVAVEKLASQRREADPAKERWDVLRERASRDGLLRGLPEGGVPRELVDVRGSLNFSNQAKYWYGLLLHRLKDAQRGQALHAELEGLPPQEGEVSESYMETWLKVRDWLRQRLPAHVAEGDDPREALLRLRDQLATLEARLEQQESYLRGHSEDVAQGIDVSMRRAHNQVQRLNRNLGPVSFGNIESIRVRPGPVERMQQVLRALREGSAQGLLFETDLPIEEALEEIFKRYGGGRTGGQRLLDYREYLELKVEIRRKTSTDWEPANPTRLSTGEAIGVGAALMMVVLTAWEQDATFLRGKRAHGSLRFLFLDEANRLSQENLGVLFDLCRSLDLQLLIAAPEVARAEGNTTYRLVRHTTPDGREEVRVSGRRIRKPA